MPNRTVRAAATGLSRDTFPMLDPERLPDRYAMICQGKCLEPLYMDGSVLVFDKQQPLHTGDFVLLFRRPELVKPGDCQGIVKRLASELPERVKFPHKEHPESTALAVLLVEQLNPRRQFVVRCGELLAVHKCLGLAPAGKRLMARRPELKKLSLAEAHHG